jgi:hypothetical protein
MLLEASQETLMARYPCKCANLFPCPRNQVRTVVSKSQTIVGKPGSVEEPQCQVSRSSASGCYHGGLSSEFLAARLLSQVLAHNPRRSRTYRPVIPSPKETR